MGEIGRGRSEFLYEMRWWEMMAVIRGYRRRDRTPSELIRWATHRIMCAIPYCDMAKAGLREPKDLLPLPWDGDYDEPSVEVSDEEIEELQALMAAVNEEERSTQ